MSDSVERGRAADPLTLRLGRVHALDMRKSHEERFQEALSKASADYQSATLRLAFDTSEGISKFVHGSVIFEANAAESRIVANYEYPDFAVSHRSVPILEAVQALDRLSEGGGPLFGSSGGRTNKFDGTVEASSGQKDGWAPPFGETRISGWPEDVFRFRCQGNGSFDLPIVHPGLQSILTTESLFEDFLGLPDNQSRSHLRQLSVVFPRYSGSIQRIRFARGYLKVEAKSTHLDSGELSMAVAFRRARSTIDQTLESVGPFWFGAAIGEAPEDILILLYRRETGTLLDWARLRPHALLQPPGFEVEVPGETVADLIAAGESEKVEFKTGVQYNDRDDFVESLVAFANVTGGTIVVGVEDNGVLRGIEDPEAIGKRISSWAKDLIEPPLDVQVSQTVLEGRTLIVIEVPEGGNKPYQAKRTGHFYVRMGEHDRPIQRTQLDELMRNRTEPRRARRPF